MEIVPVFVGLDYHRKSVRVCVVDGAGRVLSNRKCGNSTPRTPASQDRVDRAFRICTPAGAALQSWTT